MAAKQVDIMKIKQLLFLKLKGWSNRKIAQEVGIDRNTVNQYVQRLQSSGIPMSELYEQEEVRLQEYFPSKEYVEKDRYEVLIGLFPGIVQKLKHVGATRRNIWQDYILQYKDGYSYGHFCELFNLWLDQKNASGKIDHKAGEKLFIDFAGKKLEIVDKQTGEVQPVDVFVAILPASSYTYVEACTDQTRVSLVNCVGNCLTYIGGVPQAIVPDNLKSAVTKASKYEPVINKTFRDLGLHYGCVINPTRAVSPQDKALVENAVKYVYQRIYYKLSGMVFFNLEELNAQISILLEQYNAYKLTTTEVSRYKQFIDYEKEHLGPLPREKYQIRNYTRAKVQKMGYIYLSEQKNYYSVPYQYIGKQVEVQHTSGFVEIFYQNERIASHPKSYRKGSYITTREHLSSTHQYYASWSKEFFVVQAGKIGPETAAYITRLIDQQQYPETAYKRAQGILSLKNRYAPERIEKACRKADEIESCSFHIIKNILENNMDKEPDENQLAHHIGNHENLRRSNTYK